MHTTNLRKVGESVMLAIPPAILDLLHLQAGATVGLHVEGDRLIVHSWTKPRYTLGELLAQCDPASSVTDEDRDWLCAPAVGRELRSGKSLACFPQPGSKTSAAAMPPED